MQPEEAPRKPTRATNVPWDATNASEPPAWVEEMIPPAQLDELKMLVSIFPDLVVNLTPTGEALLKLRLDATQVTVYLLIQLPKDFDPATCGTHVQPQLHIRTATASKKVVSDLQAALDLEVMDWCAQGMFSMVTAFGRAMELVADVPLGLQSSVFGSCTACNIAAQRKNQKKAPQPLRLDPTPLEEHYGKGSPPAMAPTPVCLTCGASKDVIVVPSFVQNTDAPCSFCYFDDNPLISMQCGCRACFTCFVTFAGVSSQARDVKKSLRSSWYGVACPSHPANVLEDPALYKLLDTPVYLRMTNFAAAHCATALGGRPCRNAQCGLPALCDISGTKYRCGVCNAWSCSECQTTILACQCREWPAPSLRDSSATTAALLSEKALQCRNVAALEKQYLKVLVIFGSRREAFEFSSTDPTWASLIEKRLFDDVRGELRLFYVFQGAPLAKDHALGLYGLHTGSIIIVFRVAIVFATKTLESERDLFEFRLQVAGASNNKRPEKVDPGEGLYKGCPVCKTPVVHYRDHGCHHIGFAKGVCCGNHWCYVCRGPYPCTKCPLNCNDFCGCPPCPDCKPMMPCPYCWGCKLCKPGGGNDVFE